MLQLIALVVALGALIVWLATGASRQVWTSTTQPSGQVDEVTGIVDPRPVKKFTAGLDFLFGAWLAGAVLACSALFFGRKPQLNPQPAN
jgi:hypothetical protein